MTAFPAARLISLERRHKTAHQHIDKFILELYILCSYILIHKDQLQTLIFILKHTVKNIFRQITMCYNDKPVQYTIGHKCLLWMEVFVIHIPHNRICSSDGQKENRHHVIKLNCIYIFIR